MQYNTTREPLKIKEYGRNVQQMVAYIKTIADKDKRQEAAETLIEIMGCLNPQLKATEDYKQKLWDHLFIIADFSLDVVAPYPLPDKESFWAKPPRLLYPKKHPKYMHLGKYFEMFLQETLSITEEEKRKEALPVLVHSMKQIYQNWHKESVTEEGLAEELLQISGGALVYEADMEKPFSPPVKNKFYKKKNHPGQRHHKPNHSKKKHYAQRRDNSGI